MRELGLSAVGRSCCCWRLAGGEERRLGRSAVGFVSSVLAGEGRVCGGWLTEVESPVVVAQAKKEGTASGRKSVSVRART